MGPRFASPYSIPPGGKFFFEHNGEYVEGRNLQEIAPKVRYLMQKYAIPGAMETVLAAYMCPRLGPGGSWFCKGDFKDSNTVREREALENSEKYCQKKTVPFDVIEKRLERCMDCQKHYRGWCLTCNGHLDKVIAEFGGTRPKLPADIATGVCNCARAYEMAIASVAYGPDDKIWEGVPETCWRLNDV